jgi:hypothetical protein
MALNEVIQILLCSLVDFDDTLCGDLGNFFYERHQAATVHKQNVPAVLTSNVS